MRCRLVIRSELTSNYEPTLVQVYERKKRKKKNFTYKQHSGQCLTVGYVGLRTVKVGVPEMVLKMSRYGAR